MTRRWTLRIGAGIVVAATLLTGCSDKQEASQTLPSTTRAAETTPELPPLGPEDMPMPDEARTKDAAGAETFVRYYIQLINRTSTVMDAKPLLEFSDGCKDCDRIATNTESDAAAGLTYAGGQITITDVTPPLMKDTTASVGLRINQAALVVKDTSGAPVPDLSSDAYSDLPAGIGVRWDDKAKSWLMTDFTVG